MFKFPHIEHKEFLVVWHISPLTCSKRKYLRLHSLSPPLSILLFIIVLIVITISHLEMKVREETTCYYIRTV